MDLGLGGKSLQSVSIEYAVSMQLADAYFIVIEAPFTLDLHGDTFSMSSDEDRGRALSALRQLTGHTVEDATADDTGALHMVFEGGARVQVQPDPDYEAWNVSGPNGALVVSMPGGELAIWKPQLATAESAGRADPTPRRPMSTDEFAVIREILSRTEGLGGPLIADLGGALVANKSPWVLDVQVRNNDDEGADLPNGPFPARAFVTDGAEYHGEVIVWITGGHVSGLEYAWTSDEPPTRWPRADELEVVLQDDPAVDGNNTGG